MNAQKYAWFSLLLPALPRLEIPETTEIVIGATLLLIAILLPALLAYRRWVKSRSTDASDQQDV